MKVTTQCPLVFLLNVGCRQVGNLENEKCDVMGCELSWGSSSRIMLRSHIIWGLAVGLYVEGCIVVKFL